MPSYEAFLVLLQSISMYGPFSILLQIHFLFFFSLIPLCICFLNVPFSHLHMNRNPL